MLARAPADTLQPTDIQCCGVLAGRLLLQFCCLVILCFIATTGDSSVTRLGATFDLFVFVFFQAQTTDSDTHVVFDEGRTIKK